MKHPGKRFRVGQGYDIHRFAAGRACVIGGVTVPHALGPDGHSDADPLLHALIDALLGAAALGDIGEHFPDSDPRWKGADSRDMLREVMERLTLAGWRVVNVDATVVTEAPRLKAHKRPIAENIAKMLGVPANAVNIKAKTNEKFDAVGRGEAIAAQCIVLIEEAGDLLERP